MKDFSSLPMFAPGIEIVRRDLENLREQMMHAISSDMTCCSRKRPNELHDCAFVGLHFIYLLFIIINL